MHYLIFLKTHLFGVDHAPVIGAAILQWVIGAIWYGLIFAKPWASMVKPKEGQKALGQAVAMLACLIANFVLCFVLVHILNAASSGSLKRGLLIGFACWLGIVAPPLYVQHFYEGRPFRLFAISAGYWLVAMVSASWMLVRWQ